jgi:hypothetical protein
MQITTKVEHVTFVHTDDFKGEVEIRRGAATVTIPMSALRRIAAESVRAELLDTVQKMKPEQLLRRIA